ncbi:MAG: radical SAM protein [Vicinamibacteria bacterium]|nr:radical SAM protein [Vicinamibacteria bacterium]
MPDTRAHIRGLTPCQIAMISPDFGIEHSLARRIAQRAIGEYSDDLDSVSGLSRSAARMLFSHSRLTRLNVLDRRASQVDSFVKYLFESPDDGARFEAVRIPLEKPRYSVCVSTQVGCPLGCRFCETGRLGWSRNLSAWEMVDQVLRVRSEALDRPVTGLVFQGQGEPFLNYDNVLQAAAVLRDPSGGRIGRDRITISTVGIPEIIARYTDGCHPYRLIVSLSSAFDDRRAALIPFARNHSVRSIAAALRRHVGLRGGPIHLAWVLVSGWNTGDEEAAELVRLFDGIPLRLSLIDVIDYSGRFRPPDTSERGRFMDALAARGIAFVRRYSGGADIHAACGALSSHGGTNASIVLD